MERTIHFKNVDEYFKSQPDHIKKLLQELRDCIMTAVPDAVELINYNIPAYSLVKGGKRDQQIMIAGFAGHVGLYPHPDTISHFATHLQVYKSGKGSVQFPVNRPLPRDLIIEKVRYRKRMLES